MLASCRWLCFVIRLPPSPESLLRARARARARAKGCRMKHTFAIRTYPLYRVSSPCLFLSLGILPVLKYDRATGGLESTSRCCCRCQLLLMVIPWKWTLLRDQRRQSRKVPIIFAAIDASCQASSDKSAESAVRPIVGARSSNEIPRDVKECAAIEIFRPFSFPPLPQTSYSIFLLFE